MAVIKNKDAVRLANQNAQLRRMYEEARMKSEGCEEVMKIQNAYITILLKKLGAIKDNPAIITNDEVKEMLGTDLVRVETTEKGAWQFYIEEAEE